MTSLFNQWTQIILNTSSQTDVLFTNKQFIKLQKHVQVRTCTWRDGQRRIGKPLQSAKDPSECESNQAPNTKEALQNRQNKPIKDSQLTTQIRQKPHKQRDSKKERGSPQLRPSKKQQEISHGPNEQPTQRTQMMKWSKRSSIRNQPSD